MSISNTVRRAFLTKHALKKHNKLAIATTPLRGQRIVYWKVKAVRVWIAGPS